MKKKFTFWQDSKNKQAGFAYPFLLFFTAVFFIMLTYNFNSYQTNLEISRYHEQNIVIDSLYQMAGEQLKTELPTLIWENSSAQLTFFYPSGTVTIDLYQKNEQKIESHFILETKDGKKAVKTVWLNSPPS